MLNKHGILLTENFGRTLDYQISYLAIANVWGRSAVAYGLTCSQACSLHILFVQFVQYSNYPTMISDMWLKEV